MDQQQISRNAIFSKVRFLRWVALVGAPLLILSSAIGPKFVGDRVVLSNIAFVLLTLAPLTFIDWSVKLWHRKNLGMVILVVILTASYAGFFVWREGTVVAKASFNPGIAPFDITVREVPVPVTHSHHFIITLKRGQYSVTSFRYFWIAYTPKTVRIEWARLEAFKVIFDERYKATCNWSWGREATWTMDVPPGAQAPGDRP